jgi:hypothetical protein
MNSLNNPKAILSIVVIVLALGAIIFMESGGGPGTSTVKTLVEKQVHARFKGSVIKSISLVRAGMFLCQGRAGKVSYGSPIYPIRVRVIYTRPGGDSAGDPQEFLKSYFFYKTPAHQWAIDPNLN